VAHVDNLRRHFPAVRAVTFLNTGTFGALPDATVEAMGQALQMQLTEGRTSNYYVELAAVKQAVRDELARVFHTHAEHFTLTENTTHGMNIALWGLPLEAGDEIIYTDTEHQGGLLPAYVQRIRRGAVLKRISAHQSHEMLINDLQHAITNRTKVIVCSHISYETGNRLPIEEIAQIAHEHGAYCLVDGAQGAGAEDLDLARSHVDFYALPGQKWLCGPDGTGALYIHPRLIPVLEQTYMGPVGLADPSAYDFSGQYMAARDAQKYEHSATNFVQWTGLLTSIRYLRIQVGLDYAYSRIHGLAGQLTDRLMDMDRIRIVTSRESRAGLVSFEIKDYSAEDFVSKAKERGIDIRCIPGRNWVRVSAGFYNNEDDILRVVQMLENLNESKGMS
jgi:L-cysteine/cystine lyase